MKDKAIPVVTIHKAASTAAAIGDKTKAKSTYRDFLTLWKDADPEIPILKQARTDDASLH